MEGAPFGGTRMSLDDIRPRRSLLFVPAVRPDRFPKALAARPDVVCVDLEDSVAPAEKSRARELAMPLFAERWEDGVERLLRINSARSPEGFRDLSAVLDSRARPDGLVLPKVSSAEEVRWVADLLEQAGVPTGLHGLIETVDGLEQVQAIAGATPRLRALLFGAVDLAAEVGCALDFAALLYARSRIVHAAARHGLDALDVPYLALDDEAGLRAECEAVQRLGFTGKAAIHPKQIPVIHGVFTPDPGKIAAAQQVVQAFEEAPGGLAVVGGKLVELPVVKGMRRILAVAKAAGALEPSAPASSTTEGR